MITNRPKMNIPKLQSYASLNKTEKLRRGIKMHPVQVVNLAPIKLLAIYRLHRYTLLNHPLKSFLKSIRLDKISIKHKRSYIKLNNSLVLKPIVKIHKP